ncbi:MAG: ABC transporter ATP-binding protein/permease [Bifidobacteriaceae bacterium]|nr:ABC transporter ATP-binding protein/permease [Bifidobacteriaceae bacterium]MCI1915152.1 ABC transporter ATP-binding protein/permease [Bifidobacteriaceae bacterium]
MFRLFKYMGRSEWLQAGVSLVFVVVQVWLDLKLPDYMSKITTLVETPGSEMIDVWKAGGQMLLCALGSLVATVLVALFSSRIAASFSQTLRSLQFKKVDSFSMEEINRFSTASLITRSTNDVTQIQLLIVMGLQIIIKAPITAVWAIVKIAGKGLDWTIATGVAAAILLVMFAVLLALVVPKFRRVQTLTDNLSRVALENLTGLRVVRAYNAEGYQEGKFDDANDDLTNTQLFTSRGMAIIFPTISLVMNGLNLAIYWIGAALINSAGLADRLTLFSNMVVFSSYAMQVIMAFMMVVMMFILLPRAQVSAQRINEVLDTEPTIIDGTAQSGKPGLEGTVRFDHVSFKYPDAADYVLDDVSFTAKKGETVAFIGSTGSGKSSLINLVPRFYDASKGSVSIDGIDVKDYSHDALTKKIGYVPQKAVMFQGSVASNVAFGQDAPQRSETQIENAVSIAQAEEFVSKMPDTYDAPIAQSGQNVSGGQKQRLSIARAVYRKPEIYIFDDSFSALDYKTDKVLRKALKEQTQGVTSLIVAQRIGTIMDADQIIVIDDGKVVGKGTHRELLASNDVYRQIALSQLSAEELEKTGK